VSDDWYNSIFDLPTGSIASGNTSNIATCDTIYHFVTSQGYLTGASHGLELDGDTVKTDLTDVSDNYIPFWDNGNGRWADSTLNYDGTDIRCTSSLAIGGDFSPSYTLDVDGDIDVTTSGYANFHLEDSSPGVTNNLIFGNGAGMKWVHDNRTTDGLQITTSETFNYPISFKASGSTDMKIDTDGNVGIGTTDPSYTLDVDGDARVDNMYLDDHSSGGKFYDEGSFTAGMTPSDGSGQNSGTVYWRRIGDLVIVSMPLMYTEDGSPPSSNHYITGVPSEIQTTNAQTVYVEVYTEGSGGFSSDGRYVGTLYTGTGSQWNLMFRSDAGQDYSSLLTYWGIENQNFCYMLR
jgi:hypothetical protein